MNELIKVDYSNENPTVLGRDLHGMLEVETPYHKWFPRMCEYGFAEGTDFLTVDKNVRRADGAIMPQTQFDHQLTIAMAKELCMLQRSDKGKKARLYFIAVEEAWNRPETVMARALQMADKKIKLLSEKAEQDAPKVLFADAVAASHTSILIGELAKILRQNGVDMGQNRLFQWMRENGYLIRRNGTDYNMPTQRSMQMGLFEIKETVINRSDGGISVSKTAKVTGRGQQYFINAFLSNLKAMR